MLIPDTSIFILIVLLFFGPTLVWIWEKNPPREEQIKKAVQQYPYPLQVQFHIPFSRSRLKKVESSHIPLLKQYRRRSFFLYSVAGIIFLLSIVLIQSYLYLKYVFGGW